MVYFLISEAWFFGALFQCFRIIVHCLCRICFSVYDCDVWEIVILVFAVSSCVVCLCISVVIYYYVLHSSSLNTCSFYHRS